jgi:hypothetical protein
MLGLVFEETLTFSPLLGAATPASGLIKLAGIVRILSSVKTKLDLFTSVPGQRKRGYLVLPHEFDSCCFHARLRFASQQAAKYK